MEHCDKVKSMTFPDIFANSALTRRITILLLHNLDGSSGYIHSMGDETMRLSTMQEGAASAADIQKPFPAHSIFAGAKIEEANMIRNNKLPIRLFQAMEQPRESTS